MTKEVVNQLGLKKYEFSYRNPMSSSFFDLFNNDLKDEFDYEDEKDYEVDMYYMGENLIIENEMTGEGISL